MRQSNSNVKITGGYWHRVLERNRTATLQHALQKCRKLGYLANLNIAAGRSDAEYAGGADRDSDLFKVLEGAAYTLSQTPDPELDCFMDSVIDSIAAAQEEDGYLQSYITAVTPNDKYKDMHRSHELYCAGHLLEAAAAHTEATGKRTLLEVAQRLADHLLATFGPGKRETLPGHQEVELALVRLYQVTGEDRYLELARYFVDHRGDPAVVKTDYAGKPVIESERHPGRNRPPEYRQDHLPILEQTYPIGHAVRAGYTYTALADIARECDSASHAATAAAIWECIVAKHLYITGGVGTHQYFDEGYGDAYRLPNDTYCETCGGIALLLFTWRMSQLEKDARQSDLIETILLNHTLACPDLTGTAFHYRNPLLSDGSRRRHPWPDPACCPTNIVRVIPQFTHLMYTVEEDVLTVDQFAESEAELHLTSGTVHVKQQTRYPWDGGVELVLRPETPQEFSCRIRIPGWVDGRPIPSDLYAADPTEESEATVAVNGDAVDTTNRTRGYVAITRKWNPGDRISVNLPMPVRRIRAHEKVEADRGRVALMRGPLVYCIEETDVKTPPEALTLSPDEELQADYMPDLLGGVTVITSADHSLKAVPYYAWNNREHGGMAVWIRE